MQVLFLDPLIALFVLWITASFNGDSWVRLWSPATAQTWFNKSSFN